MLRFVTQTESDLAGLVLRLTLAVVIFPHAAQKALGWFGGFGVGGTMEFFARDLGIPALFGALAIAAEFFGAIVLALGLLSRIAAFGIGTVMVTAAVLVHRENGFFMNWFGNQKGEGFEYH